MVDLCCSLCDLWFLCNIRQVTTAFRQACSKGSREMLKEDRISQLPDPLICHILSHLPIEDSVKTSVLSTRWRSLWLWLPRLELDSRSFPDFDAFMSFGDRFFDSNRASYINKLKLRLFFSEDEVDDASYVTSWVEAAIKRKVHHLEVWSIPHGFYQIPISLFICETLVSVKLFEVVMGNAEFVSLPCLKTMRLKCIWVPNEATFEKLVSGCPVLEELNIVGCVNPLEVIRVHSLSVKRLKIKLRASMSSGDKYGVVIDAPLLRSLIIDDEIAGSYIINNLSSNAKLDISLDFGLDNFDEASVSSRTSSIRDFLLGISKVREMIIHIDTLEIICQYSKLEPVPQFAYMSHLDASIIVPDLKSVLSFLESCPNLKSLILVWKVALTKWHSEKMNQISYTFVPECLLSSLKSVEIKTSFLGYAAEMEIVKYFLENSVILEKLTLHLNYRANVNVILEKLLKIPRRSITCQVVVI